MFRPPRRSRRRPLYGPEAQDLAQIFADAIRDLGYRGKITFQTDGGRTRFDIEVSAETRSRLRIVGDDHADGH